MTTHPEYDLGSCAGKICDECGRCKYCFKNCKDVITNKQKQWLTEHDYEESDIMYDEYDDAYVIDIDEEGTKRRKYLHTI